MNYLKEERLNALAAEYVVGTLRGKARARYQKLMMQYQAVSDATAQWEQYLTGFAETLPPDPAAILVPHLSRTPATFIPPHPPVPPPPRSFFASSLFFPSPR